MAVLRERADPLGGPGDRRPQVDMTKSPPARGGLTHPDDRGPEGWVTATHCPPLGGGMELPPQGVARGWTPGFLPLLRGWGTNPKGRGEEDRGDGVGGRRAVSKKEGKAAPCPWRRAVSLCGGWGKSQILQPLWREDS